MNYKESVDWILGFTDYEKMHSALWSAEGFDLRRMEDLLSRLDNPDLKSCTVHIAGSKGKGSTAAMIASALRQAGDRVGLFTSPHLHTIRERVSINGVMISEDELVELVGRLAPEVDAVNADASYGRLTTFEVLAVLAFEYFALKRVDFQVIEVGLGGRLDATNVVVPDVSVITSISMDHMDVLGDSLVKIAGEKAGIIKNGIPVVCSPQKPEAMKVIEDVCKSQGCQLTRVGQDITWQKKEHSLEGQSFSVKGRRNTYELSIPLLGEHQMENAAVAVAVLEALGIDSQAIVDGLKNVQWPGRMQILRRDPIVVADGAHNVDSASRLTQSLRQFLTYDRLILIIGISSDKDVAGIVDVLAPACNEVIVTRSRHPRSADTSTLAEEFARHGLAAGQCADTAQAVATALKIARKGDLICAAGSLFIAAETIEYIQGLSGEVYSL